MLINSGFKCLKVNLCQKAKQVHSSELQACSLAWFHFMHRIFNSCWISLKKLILLTRSSTVPHLLIHFERNSTPELQDPVKFFIWTQRFGVAFLLPSYLMWGERRACESSLCYIYIHVDNHLSFTLFTTSVYFCLHGVFILKPLRRLVFCL